MSNLAAALLADLDDDTLDALARRLAPRLASLPDSSGEPRSEWMDLSEAAEHLRCPKSRLYSLSSARRIPVHRDGSRLLFDRTELDQWVRDGGAKRP
jgi:excisionase family DNA binding protein